MAAKQCGGRLGNAFERVLSSKEMQAKSTL
jgi:hypothetical protein